MKKFIVFLCFFGGAACFISAGLYINKGNSGMLVPTQEETQKVKAPELLSDINMTQYVSLPASFYNIDIVEDIDNIDVTEDNVNAVMYDKLFSIANHLSSVSKDEIMLVTNYTITKNNEVKDTKTDFKFGYAKKSNIYGTDLYDTFKNVQIGQPLHIEHTSFNGYDDISLDITITNIYDMPCPVTDKYISENTEYKSVANMKSYLMNDSSGEAKQIARTHTINTLIDTMMSQTTFIKLPESLIMKELDALKKDNPDATYEEAKHSLYKIFFIATVIKDYDIATLTDIEKRYAKLDDSEKEGLSDYEIERKKYLLFEDDVVTCIYKKVQVSNDTNRQEESNSDIIVEEDNEGNEEQPSDESTDDTITSLLADDIA